VAPVMAMAGPTVDTRAGVVLAGSHTGEACVTCSIDVKRIRECIRFGFCNHKTQVIFRPMIHTRFSRIAGFCILFVMQASVCAGAGSGTVQFSADTVEMMAGQEPHHGHLYIGADQVRTDFDMDGDSVIQIIDMARQEAIVINTAQKSFMRRRAPGDSVQPAPSGDANPCAGMQNLVCRETGTEKVNGRLARKYEISGAGQQGVMQFWIDVERKMPLRQLMPDGSGMELRMVAMEKLGGRLTEKWEVTEQATDGKSQTSLQWYDPELKMNIREERPGGITRELTNIKPGVQPADLFSVPAGYSEIAMPTEGE